MCDSVYLIDNITNEFINFISIFICDTINTKVGPTVVALHTDVHNQISYPGMDDTYEVNELVQ